MMKSSIEPYYDKLEKQEMKRSIYSYNIRIAGRWKISIVIHRTTSFRAADKYFLKFNLMPFRIE